MKKFFLFSRIGSLALVAGMFQGCLKDTCSRTYTVFTPVYKTVAEVRANIKNSVPIDVQRPGKMFVIGNTIFLNEVDKGVHIIDNSNPAKPVNKHFVAIPGNIDLAVQGNFLYADLYSDLVTIDISNPAAITVKSIVENAFPFRRYANGFVADASKIIVDWQQSDTTVECSQSWRGWPGVMVMDAFSLNASANSVKAGVGGSMARFSLLDNYLYTVTTSGLNVFSIAQQAKPSLINTLNFGWDIETIFPFKNKLFIGSMAGMYIFNTNNPAKPVQESRFAHARVCDPVIADDNFAYVTLRSGTQCAGFTNQLDILNIENIASPALVKTYPLTNPHGLSKYDNLLFICDGKDGLKVYNAANVNDLKLVKTFGGFESYDVIVYNNTAIVSAKDGIYQYDFSNPNNITFLSKISISKN